jgi:hypothetical protein
MTRLNARLGSGIAIVVALLLPASAQAAPNPYGPRSAQTTIVLHSDGSYDVTLRQTQELVREYQVTFGAGVHDGFRLPDDGTLLPPYLRAGYAVTAVTAEQGQPKPPDFTRTNHLFTAASTGTYPAGRHEFQISYRVTGAALPTARGWTVHVRLLDVGYHRGERVEINADEIRPSNLLLRCVTYSPDSEPCGTNSGTALIDVFEDDYNGPLPPEFRIEVEADNAAVPEPAIDRH